MNLTSIACKTCGGSIDIPADAEQVTCPFCGSRLAVDRGQAHAVTKAAEQVSGAVTGVGETVGGAVTGGAHAVGGAVTGAADTLSSAITGAGDGTQQAIRLNTVTTEAALDRLTWSQQLLSAETQLTAVQSEIRSLQRQKETRTTRQQTRDLQAREQELQGQIDSLRKAIAARRTSEAEAEARAQTEPARQAGIATPKQWSTAVILCALLGPLGAHRFYTGYVLIGLIQLVTLGGAGIWALIDLFHILRGSFRDAKGAPLSGRNAPAGAGCASALGAFAIFAVLSGIASQDNSSAGAGFIIIGLVVAGACFLVRSSIVRGQERRRARSNER